MFLQSILVKDSYHTISNWLLWKLYYLPNIYFIIYIFKNKPGQIINILFCKF